MAPCQPPLNECSSAQKEKAAADTGGAAHGDMVGWLHHPALQHLRPRPPGQPSDTQHPCPAERPLRVLCTGASYAAHTRLNREATSVAPHSTSPTVPLAGLAWLWLLPRHNATHSGEPHCSPCMKAGNL